jgi:single-strand DNA-binding protein
VAEKYVKKGTQIYIEGRIKTRSYDDAEGNKKYITEIVGDQMTLLGRRPDDDGMQSAAGGGGQASQGGQSTAGEGAQAPTGGQSAEGGAQAPTGGQAPSQNQTNDTGTAPGSDPFDGGDNGPDDLPF